MNNTTRLPNIIIAGTVKAGTTSLFSYLVRHPDICGSSSKETCYFLPLRYGNALEPLDSYKNYFERCQQEKFVLEATPGYFEGGRTVAEAIKNVLGDVHVLIVLRDPVDRLISFFRYHQSQMNLPKDMSFFEYIAQCKAILYEERKEQVNDPYWGIDGGYYADHLKEWLEVFGADNVRVIFFEHLKENPRWTMQELCAWLNLDGNVYSAMEFSIENKTMRYRFAKLHRLAIRVNSALEASFRRHPHMKQILRNIYYIFNSSSVASQLSAETEHHVRQIYADSIRATASLLRKYGYRRFPPWMANEGGKSAS